MRKAPIATGREDLDKRVVYSPHIYGPEEFSRHDYVRMYWGGGVRCDAEQQHVKKSGSATTTTTRAKHTPPHQHMHHAQFRDKSYPDNMPGVWDHQFRWIEKARGGLCARMDGWMLVDGMFVCMYLG